MVFSQTQTRQAAQAAVWKSFEAVRAGFFIPSVKKSKYILDQLLVCGI